MAKLLSVRAICFEDGFYTSKNVSGFQHGVPCAWQLPWLAMEKPWLPLAWPFPADVHTVHMAAALAGCRKALVSTGLALTQTGVDKAPLPF